MDQLTLDSGDLMLNTSVVIYDSADSSLFDFCSDSWISISSGYGLLKQKYGIVYESVNEVHIVKGCEKATVSDLNHP